MFSVKKSEKSKQTGSNNSASYETNLHVIYEFDGPLIGMQTRILLTLPLGFPIGELDM